jgi:pyruvate,water dikinase
VTQPASGRIAWFADPRCADVRVAGGKGASLAALAATGHAVPAGFVVASHVLAEAVDTDRLRALARTGDHAGAQALVAAAAAPEAELHEAYDRLGGGRVAVRSSACAEDGAEASFAGQQDTYLEVEGADLVCRRVVDCWASFFSERALFYRGQMGSLDDLEMAVVVQRMVEARVAGVLFTVDPVSRRRDRMLIEAATGLGEQVVSGEVTPDHWIVDRAGRVKTERLPHGGVLTGDELAGLAALGTQLAEHFGAPQDIEWAIDDEGIKVLQSRPVTTL